MPASRLSGLLIGSTAAFLAGPAWAGDLVQHARPDRCAAYGPGFAAVAGSDTCLRIGGRVRVEAGNGAIDPNSGWANERHGSDGFVPAGATEPLQSPRRLRLDSSDRVAR